MVNLKIDNKDITVSEMTSILDAAKLVGINIPNLCYLKEINEIGACRVCVVEIKGKDRLVSSCNTRVYEGMEVFTNSPKVRESRRINVEFILSQHDCHCPMCIRKGTCDLQDVATNLSLPVNNYKICIQESDWPQDFPLIRDEGKCIKCMRCVQICDKVQDLNIWDVAKTGSRTTVGTTLNRYIKDTDCSLCGQCIVHCPTAALHEREDIEPFIKMDGILNDSEVITIVQMAPSIRTSWGEDFGVSRDFATAKRLVSALRKIGFDYIFDTDFGADLTITEEASEFLERLKEVNEKGYPMFTSCCPAWVRFMKSQYPDMVDRLSTSKSPHQMFGAIAKTYYAKMLNTTADKICCISIMPCLAKKHECDIPNINDSSASKDVDYVLTTREITSFIRSECIDVKSLEEEEFDKPLGESSGAGDIFGATGGVMEAALRTAYYIVNGENPDAELFKVARGMDGIKEFTVDMKGSILNIAVVSGLGNARKLIELVRSGEKKYDFVEVMACPGGCTSGGGQPIHSNKKLGEVRCSVLYNIDKRKVIRFSHENPSIKKLYEDFLGEPLSDMSEKLLHTDHSGWDMPLAPHLRRK